MGTWHFIAMWPAADDAARLGTLAGELGVSIPGARPERAERMHLTLAFMGKCSPRDIVVAAQAAADAALTTGRDLLVTMDHIDVFGKGRVLAAVPDGRAEGTLLHAREIAAARLRHGGVSIDARTFHPHVSLVRLPAAAQSSPPIEPQRVRLDRISLVASSPGPDGSPRSWRSLETWPLERPRR